MISLTRSYWVELAIALIGSFLLSLSVAASFETIEPAAYLTIVWVLVTLSSLAVFMRPDVFPRIFARLPASGPSLFASAMIGSLIATLGNAFSRVFA